MLGIGIKLLASVEQSFIDRFFQWVNTLTVGIISKRIAAAAVRNKIAACVTVMPYRGQADEECLQAAYRTAVSIAVEITAISCCVGIVPVIFMQINSVNRPGEIHTISAVAFSI